MLSKKKLSTKLKNTLQSTPLALNPVNSVLNRDDSLSVQNKVLIDNNPEVGLLQHTGEQNLRVSVDVYVLNKRGQPLMPTCCRKARLLLKQGKASVFKRFPFTIKLNYQTGENKQKIRCGIDSGYSNVGFSCVSTSKELIRGTLILDNFTTKHLTEKRMYRRGRRNKLRYREPRFNNRIRNENWLPSSIERRYQAHINLIKNLKQFLPITEIIVEVGNFDIQKLNNPEITTIDYQKGNLYRYRNEKAFILSREKGKCQLCGLEYKKDNPWNLHHIIQKSAGGTDKVSNLALLHKRCHDKLHKKNLKIKRNKQYIEPAFMNIVKNRFQNDLNCKICFGYETFINRNELKLEKSHDNDAFVIAGGMNQERSFSYLIEQKRRNNRCLQLNRKGFKPSIRRKRYRFQPKDLVKITGKIYEVVGCHSYGKSIVLKDDKKNLDINIKKLDQWFFNQKSFIYRRGVNLSPR